MKYSKTRELIEVRPPVVDQIFTWATDAIGLTSVVSFNWFLESFNDDDVHWESLDDSGLSIEVEQSFAKKRLKTIVVLESGLAIVGVSSATLRAEHSRSEGSLATDRDVLEKTKEYVQAFEIQLEVLRKEREKIWQASQVDEKLEELNSSATALRKEIAWAIQKISEIRKSYLEARGRELQAKRLEDADRALAAREFELIEGFAKLARLRNDFTKERHEFAQEALLRSRDLDSKGRKLELIQESLKAGERELEKNSSLKTKFDELESLQNNLEAEIAHVQMFKESWPSLDQEAKSAIFEVAARERARIDRSNRSRSESLAMQTYIVKSTEICVCCNLHLPECKNARS